MHYGNQSYTYAPFGWFDNIRGPPPLLVVELRMNDARFEPAQRQTFQRPPICSIQSDH